MGRNTQCYLCKSTSLEQVDGKVRDMPELPILKCQQCGLVFLESFDHINPSYYSDSHMYDNPVGGLPIEYDLDRERRIEYCKPLISNKKILDFGCGHGGFLLKVQELVKQAHGLEPDEGDRSFFREQGLTVFTNMKELQGEQYDLITLFLVLEHLHDPREILKSLKSHLLPKGKILIEVPNADDALLKLYKNKGFQEFNYWGCHLFIYTDRSLEKLLIQAGFQVEYIQQIQRYPLSNHLHWLTHNQPGGHLLWSFLDSERLKTEYANRLASLGMCDTLIALVSEK